MRPLRQRCSYLKMSQSGASTHGHEVLYNRCTSSTYTAKDKEQAHADRQRQTERGFLLFGGDQLVCVGFF